MRNWFVGSKAVFWGETIAVLAFWLSWFLKGSELFNILLVEHGRPAGAQGPRPERASAGSILLIGDSSLGLPGPARPSFSSSSTRLLLHSTTQTVPA